MLILQAILLGIIQGATEFIPVSSSAHLIIVPWLFGWKDAALTSLTFDVALHIGTLIAVIVYFAGDWWRLIRAGIASLLERKIGDDPDRRLAWFVLIGTIPGGIAGVFGEKKIEALFHQPDVPIQTTAMIVMAVIIALLGTALYFADKMARHTRKLEKYTLKDVILIGLAQALAIFPGVSRSGSTMTAALALGSERESAARFSFLLSAPIIAGAGAKSLLELFKGISTGAIASSETILFPIGVIAAAISGFICIRFMLHFLQRNTVRAFAYYRWGLAVLLIVVALLRA
jgi:undecaprenyl-diphosphatase